MSILRAIHQFLAGALSGGQPEPLLRGSEALGAAAKAHRLLPYGGAIKPLLPEDLDCTHHWIVGRPGRGMTQIVIKPE
jgi:hypothetical protein